MVNAMLLQKEREHLNALIRILSDKAVRVETLNKMSEENPIVYDKKIQRDTIGEALEEAKELRTILEEAIAILEKDQAEEIEVIAG